MFHVCTFTARLLGILVRISLGWITQRTAYKLMKKQGHQAANSVGEDQVCMSSTFNDPSTIDYVFRIPPFQGGCGTAGPMDWEKLQ